MLFIKIRLKGLPWWCSGEGCAANAGDANSIPGQGQRPQMPWRYKN